MNTVINANSSKAAWDQITEVFKPTTRVKVVDIRRRENPLSSFRCKGFGDRRKNRQLCHNEEIQLHQLSEVEFKSEILHFRIGENFKNSQKVLSSKGKNFSSYLDI
ncbi:hypothetical protein AVEN_67826-1 [Araneus ventricosus]|uniref:Uncharacterized protein n=1 Tax=Araneus ventricosus TaxID=182803 RepID=A0A4Y2UD22_ARAVE|nr:hypothetical protein AVEN_67826-1 [Araneus ventricosus]